MYNAYFGFKVKPFKLVPNPEFLFLSKGHEIALAHLTYAIEHGEGFVVITGEVGTGKTTLCRNFLESLDEQTESAYIFNPHMESAQLLAAICREFGISPKTIEIQALLDLLYAHLIKENTVGHRVLLLIDEAQSLSFKSLELIRMLSNLETTRSKLLQIILVGQPELDDKLDSYELRQLTQRISLSYHLAPLSARDTSAYIQHRLWIAGQRHNNLFTPDACRMAYQFSGGVPRLINVICDRALLTAYTHNRQFVTKQVMQTAIKELSRRRKKKASSKKWPFLLGLGGCVLISAIIALVVLMRSDIQYRLIVEQSTANDVEQRQQSDSSQPVKAFKVPYNNDGGTAQDNTDNALVMSPKRSEQSMAEPKSPDQVKGAVQNPKPTVPPDGKEKIAFYPVPKPPATDNLALENLNVQDIEKKIRRLKPLSSRKNSVARILTLWGQPRPNANLIPTEVDDDSFFEIVARQYGLRTYITQNNWPLVQKINLPAIISLKAADSNSPVYVALVGWRDNKLYFNDGESQTLIAIELQKIQPFMNGTAYVFWNNIFGYDKVISQGSDSKAISVVKTLLEKIGYDRISHSTEFDSSTSNAVYDFQTRHQLKVDGLVGPLTQILLLRESGTINMPTLQLKKGA